MMRQGWDLKNRKGGEKQRAMREVTVKGKKQKEKYTRRVKRRPKKGSRG
jgi:hypothetical protein